MKDHIIILFILLLIALLGLASCSVSYNPRTGRISASVNRSEAAKTTAEAADRFNENAVDQNSGK